MTSENPMAGENRTPYGRFTRTEGAMLRDQEALALRLQGLTFSTIAEKLGVSVAAAQRMVQRGLRDAAPARAVQELRAEQAAQLDELIAALWPRMQAGSARHAEVILRALERKAKLFGLDAPEVRTIELVSQEAVEKAIVELRREINELEAGGW